MMVRTDIHRYSNCQSWDGRLILPVPVHDLLNVLCRAPYVCGRGSIIIMANNDDNNCRKIAETDYKQWHSNNNGALEFLQEILLACKQEQMGLQNRQINRKWKRQSALGC
uniref:Uncharacterized protein n=1 Tax=Micrurus spixii TaxID=129469 RepID=A0A2D4MLX6_9SAUR